MPRGKAVGSVTVYSVIWKGFFSSPGGSRCQCLGLPVEHRILLPPACILVSWQIRLHVALERLGMLQQAEIVTCLGGGSCVFTGTHGPLQSPDAFEARAWARWEVSPKLPARNCHVAIVSPAVAVRCC